jgi:hypothetical protein
MRVVDRVTSKYRKTAKIEECKYCSAFLPEAVLMETKSFHTLHEAPQLGLEIRERRVGAYRDNYI